MLRTQLRRKWGEDLQVNEFFLFNNQHLSQIWASEINYGAKHSYLHNEL